MMRTSGSLRLEHRIPVSQTAANIKGKETYFKCDREVANTRNEELTFV
jgi:hypothetical protein